MAFGDRLSAGRLKRISSLSLRKYREEFGECIVEGFRSLQAVAEGGADVVEIVATAAALAELPVQSVVRDMGVPVFIASPKDFDRLSNVATAQGVMAVVRTRWNSFEHVAKLRRVIALDGVQDPGNAGTIVRLAAWMGVEGVLAGPGSADLFGPKVIRASMGGLWDVRVARCSDLSTALQTLTTRGYGVAAADLTGTSVSEWSPKEPTVLVLGNEASGISTEARTLVGEYVTVPRGSTAHATESLNVAAAAAIIVHRWCMAAPR